MRKALYFCAGLLLSGVAIAAPAEPRDGRKVEDPHYGDVLFYFYQDNFFEAITRLMAAREMGRAAAHTDDGDLLMGGMLLSYGQHERASEIFQRLLTTTTKPEVRDRAWFFLARVSFERGALDQAEAALGKIEGKLPPRMDAERHLLAAQVLMDQGRYDEAATMLSAWKGPEDWANYARFNLGVAMVRAQRVDEGAQYLEQAGSATYTDPEQLALRDRANVALGFAAIQAQKYDSARTAFQRVRLQGPYSSKALLGLGWAESALDRDREALVPWLELKDRDLLDPAVQESLLAVPYAMARLSAYGQAASNYETAIKSFDDEAARLDTSIASIRGGQLVPALLADDPIDQMGWVWKLDKLSNTVENRYLVHLLASRPFNEGLKNYRDLRFLNANLVKWSQDVAAFQDILTTQKVAFEQRKPNVQQTLKQIDVDALEKRHVALTDRLARIEKDHDPVGLASDIEQGQLARLQAVSERIDKLGDSPEALDLKDRMRVLKGVLLWDLDHDYKLRLWKQKRAGAELDKAMTAVISGRKTVDAAFVGEPARLDGFSKRVDQQTPRIAALIARTEKLLAREQSFLQELAVDELEQYKERLRSYTVEARFALAQIYDRAANPPKPSSKPADAAPVNQVPVETPAASPVSP